jgi:hypothetical protein
MKESIGKCENIKLEPTANKVDKTGKRKKRTNGSARLRKTKNNRL